MVHRAICGSMERFTGILIEHFAGHFPLWLAPVQAVVTTITSDGDDYAKQVLAAVRRAGLRANIDLRNEKINYKVREHSLAKIPALLVVGKKEAEQQTVSIRRLGSDKQQVVPLTEAIAALVEEATPPDVKRMRIRRKLYARPRRPIPPARRAPAKSNSAFLTIRLNGSQRARYGRRRC